MVQTCFLLPVLLSDTSPTVELSMEFLFSGKLSFSLFVHLLPQPSPGWISLHVHTLSQKLPCPHNCLLLGIISMRAKTDLLIAAALECQTHGKCAGNI